MEPDILYSNDVKPRTNILNAGQWHSMLMILEASRLFHNGMMYSLSPRGIPRLKDDRDTKRGTNCCGVGRGYAISQ